MKIYPSTSFVDPITTPTTISVNSASDALRITQAGSGNALLVEDSANPDATPFVIDPNGNVGIGINNPSAYVTNGMVLKSSNGFNPSVMNWNAASDSSPPLFVLRKDRAGATVQSGDELVRIIITGYDGTNFINAATISAAVDGTPGTNDMPGRLTFNTTADGASNPTERMRIDNAGNVGIGATANASALLDVQSTTKGVRMPNMTSAEKNAISSPAAGLMVFDTTLSKLCVYSGAAWQTITSL